jgi:ABC-type transporter MlaC component
LSIGASWTALTQAQRQQLAESFGRYISAIYTDRLPAMPDSGWR